MLNVFESFFLKSYGKISISKILRKLKKIVIDFKYHRQKRFGLEKLVKPKPKHSLTFLADCSNVRVSL